MKIGGHMFGRMAVVAAATFMLFAGPTAAAEPPAVEKRIALPERLTVRGGPPLPAAFDWLAGEAGRVAPRP
jgi:hypothetical protein